jgi:uncharacterized protein (TIGR00369 family)
MESAGAFLDHVGPVLARGETEQRVLGLLIDDRHTNAHGTAHGGLLATLVDFSLGRAVHAALDDDAAVTVSLTTDYLSAAKPGDFVEAHTKVERVGGKLAFADCSLRVSGGDEVVRGRAVFAVVA